MKLARATIGFAVLLLLASRAGAEDSAFDDFLVAAKDLPEGYRLVEGEHWASANAKLLFEKEGEASGLTAPRRKAAFSIAAPGGEPGTVLLFEYEAPLPRRRRIDGLAEALYGTRTIRSPEHPEEVIPFGRFLLVLSFPIGDPAAEAYKAWLRKVRRVPAPRWRAPVETAMDRLRAADRADDPAAVLEEFASQEARLADVSAAWTLRGRAALATDDSGLAAKSFRRALELHDSLEDPLGADEGALWSCLDGLGLALLLEREPKEAAQVLERAVAVGATIDGKETAETRYDLARAYAARRKWKPALENLARAIRADPRFRIRAQRDLEFGSARKRKDFKELIGE